MMKISQTAIVWGIEISCQLPSSLPVSMPAPTPRGSRSGGMPLLSLRHLRDHLESSRSATGGWARHACTLSQWDPLVTVSAAWPNEKGSCLVSFLLYPYMLKFRMQLPLKSTVSSSVTFVNTISKPWFSCIALFKIPVSFVGVDFIKMS